MKFKITYSILTLFIILFFSGFSRISQAAVFNNYFGSYTDLGDEGNVSGIGLTIGVDRFMSRYIDNTSICLSTSFQAGKTGKGTPFEAGRFFIPLSAGVVYINPIFSSPAHLQISCLIGGAYIQKYGPAHSGPFIDPSETEINKGYGPHAELKTGFNYIISQKISFFIDGGYQWTYLKADYIAENLSGIQISAGMRYMISGMNRSLSDE